MQYKELSCVCCFYRVSACCIVPTGMVKRKFVTVKCKGFDALLTLSSNLAWNDCLVHKCWLINHAYTLSGVVHPSITCDVCGQDQTVYGMRWKCAKCFDYDLCTPCYMGDKHSVEHAFVRFDSVGNRYVYIFSFLVWLCILCCMYFEVGLNKLTTYTPFSILKNFER